MICVTCSDDTTMRIWDPGDVGLLESVGATQKQHGLVMSNQDFLDLFGSFFNHLGSCMLECQHMSSHCQITVKSRLVQLQDLMGRTCLAVLEGHASRVTCLRGVLRSSGRAASPG